MLFTSYSLFTVVFFSSIFIAIFILLTSFVGVVERTPLWLMYTFISVIGLRLIIPTEFTFSKAVNSFAIMPMVKEITTTPLIRNTGDVSVTLSKIIYALWGIGALVAFFMFTREYYGLCCNLKYLKKSLPTNVNNALNEASCKLGIKHTPNIIINNGIASPAEFGFFKQTIFINKYDYTDKELYYILLHELTHYRLQTNRVMLFTTIIASLFWWNPVIYWFRSHVESLMEMYVDAYIAKHLSFEEKCEYLDCLHKVSRVVSGSNAPRCVVVNSMAKVTKKDVLFKRFKMITAKSKANIPLCVVLSVLLACYINLVGVYVIQPAYEPPEEDMEDVVDIGSDNAYIEKEGDRYVLYYNGERIASSDDYESLAKSLKISDD